MPTFTGSGLFADIWRPVGGSTFRLISKTPLPTTPAGVFHYDLDHPIAVQKDDVIGIHSRRDVTASIAFCHTSRHGYGGACAQGQYVACLDVNLREDGLALNSEHSLSSTSQRKHAIKATLI